MVERLTGYVVGAVAATVAVMGAIGFADPRLVSSVVLAILAVLVTVLARHHSTLADVEAKLAASGQQGISVRYEYPDLGAIIANSRQVDIIAGISFKTTVGLYYAQFMQSLSSGCGVRLICPNPNNRTLCEFILENSPGRASVEHARLDVTTGILNAMHLGQEHPGGSVDIRVMDYLPSFGLVITYPKTGSARAWLKPMMYRVTSGEYLTLEFSQDSHPDWIDYLETQFSNHWNRSVDAASVQGLHLSPPILPSAATEG